MKNILIDAGPIIALFDKDDKYHHPVLNFFKQLKTNLVSTWPVITEVTHMLDFHIKVQIDFLKWVNSGGLTIATLSETHIQRMIDLIEKYSSVPMDLADCSLIILAEEMRIGEIITIDSDYQIYRTKKKSALVNILEPYL